MRMYQYVQIRNSVLLQIILKRGFIFWKIKSLECKISVYQEMLRNQQHQKLVCMQTSLKVDVLNIPGATSGDIVDKIDDIMEGKPESLIVRVGTNDLTNNVSFLSNVKKIVNKVKKHLSRYCSKFFKHYYQTKEIQKKCVPIQILD